MEWLQVFAPPPPPPPPPILLIYLYPLTWVGQYQQLRRENKTLVFFWLLYMQYMYVLFTRKFLIFSTLTFSKWGRILSSRRCGFGVMKCLRWWVCCSGGGVPVGGECGRPIHVHVVGELDGHLTFSVLVSIDCLWYHLLTRCMVWL